MNDISTDREERQRKKALKRRDLYDREIRSSYSDALDLIKEHQARHKTLIEVLIVAFLGAVVLNVFADSLLSLIVTPQASERYIIVMIVTATISILLLTYAHHFLSKYKPRLPTMKFSLSMDNLDPLVYSEYEKALQEVKGLLKKDTLKEFKLFYVPFFRSFKEGPLKNYFPEASFKSEIIPDPNSLIASAKRIYAIPGVTKAELEVSLFPIKVYDLTEEGMGFVSISDVDVTISIRILNPENPDADDFIRTILMRLDYFPERIAEIMISTFLELFSGVRPQRG